MLTARTNSCFTGDIIYFRLFGQDNIVINSEEIARDLLDNRSQNYSDRPELVTNELYGLLVDAHSFRLTWLRILRLGADYNTAFMPYNSRWRLQRKMLQKSFRQDVVPVFRPMQATKTHELLLNMMEDPAGYIKHFEA
jgi:cytochrome P450